MARSTFIPQTGSVTPRLIVFGGGYPVKLNASVPVGSDPEIAEGPFVAVLDAGHGDHLGADESGSVAPALASVGLDADSRHRGQHKPPGDFDVSEEPVIRLNSERAHLGRKQPVEVCRCICLSKSEGADV